MLSFTLVSLRILLTPLKQQGTDHTGIISLRQQWGFICSFSLYSGPETSFSPLTSRKQLWILWNLFHVSLLHSTTTDCLLGSTLRDTRANKSDTLVCRPGAGSLRRGRHRSNEARSAEPGKHVGRWGLVQGAMREPQTGRTPGSHLRCQKEFWGRKSKTWIYLISSFR